MVPDAEARHQLLHLNETSGLFKMSKDPRVTRVGRVIRAASLDELPQLLTGDWQILGRTRVPPHEMVGIDYRYVADWTLWGDVKMLLRMIPYVLARGGM